MKLPEIEPWCKPKFNVGDRVWIIKEKKAVENFVTAILFELVSASPGREPVLICTRYRLGMRNFEAKDYQFGLDEVYTEEEVKELVKWHPVKGLAKEEWKKAIGGRDDAESLENCELSRCCAVISDTRDLLLKCQEEGGLIERDVRTLCQYLGEHELPLKRKNLDKIFEQLGILGEIIK